MQRKGRGAGENIISDMSGGSHLVKFSHHLESSSCPLNNSTPAGDWMSQNDLYSRGKKRRREEKAGYVTPLSVLCLTQCGDVSFLTALVSNLASLLFLEPRRDSETDY